MSAIIYAVLFNILTSRTESEHFKPARWLSTLAEFWWAHQDWGSFILEILEGKAGIATSS